MILTPWKVILLSNPPPLWNFLGLWPPHLPGISNSLHGGGLDIFWNLHSAHCLKIYILLYVLNKNTNIVNAGYWILSENPRNFGCNISIRCPSIQSLVGREGNKMSARRGVGYVIFSWREIVQEMARPFLSSSKTCLLYKLLLKHFIA